MNRLFNSREILTILASVLILAACHKNRHKITNPQVKSAGVERRPVMDDRSTITMNLSRDSEYSTLSRALQFTQIDQVLNKPGPFTVFAPANNVFRTLPDGSLDNLLTQRKNDLVNILSHHIVAGQLRESDLTQSRRLKTLAGDELVVTTRGDELLVNGIRIDRRGVPSNNGIIYSINGLLYPNPVSSGSNQTVRVQ